MPPEDFRQIQRHGRGVGARQDQADEFPVVRTDAAKDMCVLAHPMGGHLGTAAEGSPAPNRIAQPAKPGLSSSNISRNGWCGCPAATHPLWPEVLLKAARAAGLSLGCLGRGESPVATGAAPAGRPRASIPDQTCRHMADADLTAWAMASVGSSWLARSHRHWSR